ncbi:hypothetical protein [Flavobacterium sp.]|uniref:hypothetical protein n=1 Tax=Flavobacterium sp. TaxID=239 RepID=UPI004033E086
MTRYETIRGMGDRLTALVSLGVIPIHIAYWKIYYEEYVKELDAGIKSGRAEKSMIADVVADKYGITRRTVYNIIAFMEGK